MYESIPIIAFDQHAASVTAAVLLPGQRTPALHQLTPDLRDDSAGSSRGWAARVCGVVTKPGPGGFELQRVSGGPPDRL